MSQNLERSPYGTSFAVFSCTINFPYFASTHLIKHQHGTSEQGLGICRDSSHLTSSKQFEEPAIRVESKVTSLQRKTYISSANELDKLWANDFQPQGLLI